jgi:lipopolysaccharide biosynthesis protein
LIQDDSVRSLSPARNPAPGAKLVAYYLPQFYPTEENNEWWGNGFTEWTNVTKALPQFVGHHQPQLPIELGLYDLRVPGIQGQQVALAKKAGLSAFCFYFYWFSGKTLLEKPVRDFAESPDIDFEFCLCWANDDWTRRWAGSDDLLISQLYDPEDDIAFISHLSQYLRNKNYLRVDGKPLIIVYRASLLPDAAATVGRWRDWCEQHGIGPIHVCANQCYDRWDPTEYGIDSATQFPPGDSRWIEPNIARYQGPIELLNENFEGQLLDYNDLVRRAEDFVPPAYQLFRAVCPSWDNEARRPGKGRVLIGADPHSYLRYLETTLSQTLQSPDSRDKLVFINAWNEWGEGAHLEPDRRFGFGYLEATKMAGLRSTLKHTSVAEPQRIAVVIHAFYVELLEECMGWLKDLTIPHDIFVTVPSDKRLAVEAFVARHQLSVNIQTVENRGRDVAPFLQTLRTLDFESHGRVLKLHTKMSNHTDHGHQWRKSLFKSLTDIGFLKDALAVLDCDSDIGIIGPREHLLSMMSFLGRNEAAVRRLAERMGVPDIEPADDSFIAGTMFVARTKALLPLASLGILNEDFEPELGQTNGTLAHAIERAMTYSARAAGYKVAGLDLDNDSKSGILNYEGSTTYAYARLPGISAG